MERFEGTELFYQDALDSQAKHKDDYLIFDETGKTLLMQAVIQGFVDGVDHILAQSGRGVINFATVDGTTALHYAIAAGDPTIVAKLLSGGAKTDAADNDGRTPLWLAAQKQDSRMVTILLDYGATIDKETGGSHITPLMVAAKNGRYEVVDILLERGADAAKKSAENKTAADYARGSLDNNMGNSVNQNQALTRMILKLEAAERLDDYPLDVMGYADLNEEAGRLSDSVA
ncbi:MAG: ankyrin repeat domain-containing protein [Desulfobulbaceae bacterium]|nr:ankyrin repeat domain-containing protein [Desulfobulbaceae bacterium]HIJ79331.1 hypothetical protein [Deltaproteobacteria bacterium]